MMLQFSEKNDLIAAAYVAAQKNVKRAAKDANNPHFKAKYADLESVDDACRDAYHAQDIAIIQAPGLVVEGKMHMATMLLHKSGQHVSSELSVPLTKQDAQAYGSAVTYARRYALAAMTGVIAGEDDDGNAASAPAPRQAPKLRTTPAADEPGGKEDTAAQWAAWGRGEMAKFAEMDMIVLKAWNAENVKNGRLAKLERHAPDTYEEASAAYRERLAELTPNLRAAG